MPTQKITQNYEKLDNSFVSVKESMRDYFGYAVAAQQQTVVVGAPGQDVLASNVNRQHNHIIRNAGMAYIYERQTNGPWDLKRALMPPVAEGSGRFGDAVATDGNSVVIGMPSKDGDIKTGGINVGAIYIYEKMKNGVWDMTPVGTGTFFGDMKGARFGHSVAVSGDTIVIGAPGQNDGAGAVYVCERPFDDWVKPEMLPLPNKLQANQMLGRSVAIDKDLIVVGAPGKTAAVPGCVFVYKRDRKKSGEWTLIELAKPAGLKDQWLGRSVAVDGEHVLVGAPNSGGGGALLYKYEAWDAPMLLPSPATTKHGFGRRVALHGKTAVVGASNQYASTGGKEAGRAYLYKLKENGSWTAPIIMEPPYLDGNEAKGYFGGALGLTETAVVVGAPFQDPQNRQSSGRVFIQNQKEGGSWLIDTIEDERNQAPYFFDTATAWNDRLQNVLACIQTTQEIADNMVEQLRLTAHTVEDWYELTQINSLRVLLENLHAFGKVQVRESFSALTTIDDKRAKREPVYTNRMRRVLAQMSTDLELFQRALDQRQRVSKKSSTQGRALLTADVVAAQAIKPARGFLLQNRNIRIITYLSQMTRVRVFPYDPQVILIGVPFASVAGAELNRAEGNMKQINWDFLMLPHEVGHFLYRYSSPSQQSLKAKILQALDDHTPEQKKLKSEILQALDDHTPEQASLKMQIIHAIEKYYARVEKQEKEVPVWIHNWLEEIFADVYGCLLAGPIAIFGLQDVLSDQDKEEILADNGHHPIPAIRPFIGSDILRRISEDVVWYNRGPKSAYNKLVFPNTPDLLDANWRAFLSHRYKQDGLFSDLENHLFKIDNELAEHDHYHGHDGQQRESEIHEHDDAIELTLSEIRQELYPIIDIILQILSNHLYLMKDEFPWSKDATSLDGLYSTLQEGIPMPVEPFGKLPDPTLHEWPDSAGKPIANKKIGDSLSLWAHRGPEGGHIGSG